MFLIKTAYDPKGLESSATKRKGMGKAGYYSKPLEILRCPKKKERKGDIQCIRDISLVSPFNSLSIGIFMLTDSEFLSQMVRFGSIL